MSEHGNDIKNTLRRMLAECKMEMAGSGINPQGWDLVIQTIKTLGYNMAQAAATVCALEEYINENYETVTDEMVEKVKAEGTAKKMFEKFFPEEWEKE